MNELKYFVEKSCEMVLCETIARPLLAVAVSIDAGAMRREIIIKITRKCEAHVAQTQGFGVQALYPSGGVA